MKTPAELPEGRRERLEHMAVKSGKQQGEIAVLTAENARLRAALKIYADTNNWGGSGQFDTWGLQVENRIDGHYDGPAIARKALEAK